MHPFVLNLLSTIFAVFNNKYTFILRESALNISMECEKLQVIIFVEKIFPAKRQSAKTQLEAASKTFASLFNYCIIRKWKCKNWRKLEQRLKLTKTKNCTNNERQKFWSQTDKEIAFKNMSRKFQRPRMRHNFSRAICEERKKILLQFLLQILSILLFHWRLNVKRSICAWVIFNSEIMQHFRWAGTL